MAFVADEFQDASHRPSYAEGANGKHAVKWFTVNTANILAARFASGLPAYGDAYSAQTPLLRVYDVDYEYAHGVVDTNGNGGTCHVRVSYREPADGLPLPEPGLSYMLMDGQLASLLLKWDNNLELPPPGSPPAPAPAPTDEIDGGKGMNVVYGEPVARVVIFPARPERYDLLRVIRFHRDQLVNSTPMTLPAIPLYGQLNRTFAPGEVQYHTFKVDYEAGLMRVTHVLKFVVGGKPLDEYWWLKANRLGQNIAGEIQRSVQYRKDDLRPLLNPNP